METVIGTRTLLELVSASHGAIRVPLAQSFDYTPRFTERTIFEFDRSEAVLVVTTFDGVDIRFDYFDTDSKLVDSVLNDLDPGSDITLHDPSTLREFQVVLNMRSETTGLIFQSVLAHGCRVRGVSSAEPVREEARITIDAAAENVRRLKGAAILYTRVLDDMAAMSVYDQVIPPNSRLDSTWVAVQDDVDLAHEAQPINEDGDLVLLALKNGEDSTGVGYTIATMMGTTTITLDLSPATTDVWEFYTAYIDS